MRLILIFCIWTYFVLEMHKLHWRMSNISDNNQLMTCVCILILFCIYYHLCIWWQTEHFIRLARLTIDTPSSENDCWQIVQFKITIINFIILLNLWCVSKQLHLEANRQYNNSEEQWNHQPQHILNITNLCKSWVLWQRNYFHSKACKYLPCLVRQMHWQMLTTDSHGHEI